MILYLNVLGAVYTTPETRAEALLRGRLSPVQLEEYERRGEFNVKASDGQWYRILCNQTSYSVIDPHGYKLCAYPTVSLPRADRNLAILLFLEADVTHFRRIANKQRGGRGAVRPHGKKGVRRVQDECSCEDCQGQVMTLIDWLFVVFVVLLIAAACFAVYVAGNNWLWTAGGCLALSVANLLWLW